jgi:protease IV
MSSDNIPLTPVSPYPPQQIVVQQQTMFGRFGRWMFAAVVLLVFALIGMYGRYQGYFSPADAPQEKYHSLAKMAQKKIAIISVDGAILSAEDSFIKRQIDRVRDDTSVVAVVLRIDSPGGSVTASDYLYHHLRKLAEERKLPFVVSMGGLCASGGYYLAMAVGDQENAVYAEPTTWTGSIGVVIPHYDLSGALDALKIEDDSIASGKHKLMGTLTRPMNEEDRKLLQALVDDSYARFKSIVASGRPKFKDDETALSAVATGQIFSANDALEKGLIDKIGFIEEAIVRAAELANVSTSDVRCVKYDRPPTLFGDVLGASASGRSASVNDLTALFDLATPRAYYLWSSLPAIARASSN